MVGLGTIINCGTVILGSAIGLLVKKIISEKIEKTVMKAVGLAVMFIGLTGTLTGMFTVNQNTISVNYTILLILSLVIGGLIGEFIDIEKQFDKLSTKVKSKINIKDNHFTEGFVNASLLFCVGAMAIVGAIQDGLGEGYSILATKSIMDGIASVVLAASLGVGVFFAAIAVGLYQGLFTILASVVKPILNDAVITQISVVGNALIFAIGINMVFDKKFKIGNYLPAVFVPLIYYGITQLINIVFN